MSSINNTPRSLNTEILVKVLIRDGKVLEAAKRPHKKFHCLKGRKRERKDEKRGTGKGERKRKERKKRKNRERKEEENGKDQHIR